MEESVAAVEGVSLGMQLGVGTVRIVDRLNRLVREIKKFAQAWLMHLGE